MQCIVIIVLKIEPAGQVRYNKQQLNSQRRAKHVRTWSQPAVRLGAFLDTQTLKKNPSGHPNSLCGISKNLNLKLMIEFFHLLTTPMTLFNDIMPYFDEFKHVYG